MRFGSIPGLWLILEDEPQPGRRASGTLRWHDPSRDLRIRGRPRWRRPTVVSSSCRPKTAL